MFTRQAVEPMVLNEANGKRNKPRGRKGFRKAKWPPNL